MTTTVPRSIAQAIGDRVRLAGDSKSTLEHIGADYGLLGREVRAIVDRLRAEYQADMPARGVEGAPRSTSQPAPAAASPVAQQEPAFHPGELVRIDGSPAVWRVVDYHGPLVRLSPVPRTGRIVHPERLTRAEAPS